jgi:hypothetical protein
MLKKSLAVVTALGLTAALAASPAMAGKGPGNAGGKVKGQVVEVEQQQATGNAGELTRLTIRTRNGEQLRLHLGEPGACQNCVQVGDRIRARLGGEPGPNGARQVRSMKVRRNGEMFRLASDGNGNLVRQQSRFGDGTSEGADKNRVRTRLGDGSQGKVKGSRSGQGGGNAGGGQRGGGRGGGGRRG